MGESPSLSFVIPAFQAERWIGEAVGSALQQDGVAVEVIVVDDGSTDGTAAAVASVTDPRVRLLRQNNAGQARARNRGARAAGAPVLAFLDADDRVAPGWAAAVLAGLAEGAVVAVTDAEILSDSSVMVTTYYQEVDFPLGERQRTEVLRRNFVLSTAAVRADAFAAVGGYPEDDALRGGAEDWALWQQLLLGGGSVHLTRRVLSAYRRGHASASSAVEHMKAAELSLLSSLLTDPRLNESDRAAVRQGLRRTRGDLHRHRMHSVAHRHPRAAVPSALRTAWHWRSPTYLKTAALLAVSPAKGQSRIDRP